MAAPRSRSMVSVVLTACMAAAPLRAGAQPRLETRGDQSSAISAGGNVIVNHGYTPAQLQGLIDLVTRSSTEAAEARREVGDLRGSVLIWLGSQSGQHVRGTSGRIGGRRLA